VSIDPDHLMTRPMFWVIYGYGQGGLWALVRADSAEQVRARFPQLEVHETAPAFLTEETRAAISKSGVRDLEAATSGGLADFVPPVTQSISSVAEFERFLEFVQGQLRNGTLKQRVADAPGAPTVDVLQMPPRGPWPDVVEADFVDGHG
jgi:hypothetical protein